VLIPLSDLTGDLRQRPILLGALLVFATLLLYGRVAHHAFLVFDDDVYVTRNLHVSTGLRFANIVWAFTSFTRPTGIRSPGFPTWRIVNCLG
jgi:hypothetical protein